MRRAASQGSYADTYGYADLYHARSYICYASARFCSRWAIRPDRTVPPLASIAHITGRTRREDGSGTTSTGIREHDITHAMDFPGAYLSVCLVWLAGWLAGWLAREEFSHPRCTVAGRSLQAGSRVQQGPSRIRIEPNHNHRRASCIMHACKDAVLVYGCMDVRNSQLGSEASRRDSPGARRAGPSNCLPFPTSESSWP